MSVDAVRAFKRYANLVRSGEPALGYVSSMASNRVVRAIATAGCDFVMIDTEHPSTGPDVVHDLILATAGTDCAPVVRVADESPTLIKPAIDSGAVGIWIPLVESAAQARIAVSACRYPPVGTRGVGPGLALDRWGLSQAEYFSAANDAIVVTLLVESVAGVAALPEILDVAGIDVIAVARSDLAASAGHLGDDAHPEVLAMCDTVERQVRAAGVGIGEVARSRAEAEDFVRRRFSTITVGSDRRAIHDSVAASLHGLRQARAG